MNPIVLNIVIRSPPTTLHVWYGIKALHNYISIHLLIIWDIIGKIAYVLDIFEHRHINID